MLEGSAVISFRRLSRLEEQLYNLTHYSFDCKNIAEKF
jgi:hypothetical protein